MFSMIAVIGALVTGIFAIIFGINSMVNGNQIAASICLIAAALAFGSIIFKASSNQKNF